LGGNAHLAAFDRRISAIDQVPATRSLSPSRKSASRRMVVESQTLRRNTHACAGFASVMANDQRPPPSKDRGPLSIVPAHIRCRPGRFGGRPQPAHRFAPQFATGKLKRAGCFMSRSRTCCFIQVFDILSQEPCTIPLNFRFSLNGGSKLHCYSERFSRAARFRSPAQPDLIQAPSSPARSAADCDRRE